MNKTIVSITLFLFFFLLAHSAQEPAFVSLFLSPRFPQPHETVRAHIASYSFDTARASFSWHINGTRVESGTGKNAVTFTAPGPGSRLLVEVTGSSVTGVPFEATKELYMNDVDLLWSANTYTPPWYRGKPLPTRSSEVHVTAIPHVVMAGKRIPADQLIYEWSRDNTPLFSQSGVGKDVLVLPLISSDKGPYTVKLRLQNKDNKSIQEKTITIMPRDPYLAFYELDPLRGPLFHTTVTAFNLAAGNEAQLFAVPFFLRASLLNELQYTWQVGTETLPQTQTTPYILSYKTGSAASGTQTITLQVKNPISLLETIRNSFTVHVQ